MVIVYGIPNCDTVKKAINWLDGKGTDYEFYNFKKKGISKKKLEEWVSQKGWKMILNQKSTTFRKLISERKNEPSTKLDAIKLMMEHNSVIKRPVIEKDGMLVVGFNELEMELLLKTK